jgi:hypothetical protein
MTLADSEKEILEIIARYTFLANLKDTGQIGEEKYKEIISQFGHRNHELIQYYLRILNEHLSETKIFLDNIQSKKQA